MDFLTWIWGFVVVALTMSVAGVGLVMSFWVRCDVLQEQNDVLRRMLALERADRADLSANVMELQAALRAEKFHVAQLQRKVALLQMPLDREC